MSNVIRGLMHLGLRVKNYEKSLSFYCDGLGFKKMFEFTKRDYYEMLSEGGDVADRRDENSIWLTYLRITDGQYLELFPVPDEEVNKYEERQSFFHYSLQVDNIVEAVKRLRAHGIKVYSLHKDIAEGKQAPQKFVPLKGKCNSLIAWINDPDGNMIEIMELTEESLQRKYDKLLSKAEKNK
jgi:catechol 2,3-dioxygenase-like lactoylglutathione lyase family enzyme